MLSKGMNLSPTQIDKVSEELRSFLRAEARTKKIRKMEPTFYRNIVSALETLMQESESHLKDRDISSYIRIKERMDEIERDFKALFQRRFEKIASLSVYDLDSELMSSLTPEEKEFIVVLHNQIQDQYKVLLQREKKEEPSPRIKEEGPEEKAPELKKEVETEDTNVQKPLEEKAPVEYALVLIKGDQPPIAQPDRDYFLHDQDLVYLPSTFADLLVKRGAAEKIVI
jgi:DNA replication factor GINS